MLPDNDPGLDAKTRAKAHATLKLIGEDVLKDARKKYNEFRKEHKPYEIVVQAKLHSDLQKHLGEETLSLAWAVISLLGVVEIDEHMTKGKANA